MEPQREVSALQRQMNDLERVQPLGYCSPVVEWELRIESDLLHHLFTHRQIADAAPEVGGQLFASFEKYLIRIVRVTGPRSEDKKGRFSFFPNRGKENKEIKECFAQGLHYIGDWHTHPQPFPFPSDTDIASMSDCYRRSKHELSYFVMVIVGQVATADGLWVSLHNNKSCIRMTCRHYS